MSDFYSVCETDISGDKRTDFINPYVVKCVILGDTSVGKSTLIHLFTQEKPPEKIVTTIGIDLLSKNMKISLPSEERIQHIKLQLWDTAGQASFLIKSYARDMHLAIIMFDISNRQTWLSLDLWKDNLITEYPFLPHIVLVGTKSDLSRREITSTEIQEKADKWGCRSYILSAVQDNSLSMVKRMFQIAIEDLHRTLQYQADQKNKLPPGFLTKDEKIGIKLKDGLERIRPSCCGN